MIFDITQKKGVISYNYLVKIANSVSKMMRWSGNASRGAGI